MVCALSGLPGTIQLARQRVVTAWFMLRSLICSLCLSNPSALTPSQSSSPSLILSLLPALTVYQSAKKAEATRRLRLFLSCCDEPWATFCAVGVKNKNKKNPAVKGWLEETAGRNVMGMERPCICIILFVKGVDMPNIQCI